MPIYSPWSLTTSLGLAIDETQRPSRAPELTYSPTPTTHSSPQSEHNLSGFHTNESECHRLKGRRTPTICPTQISHHWYGQVLPSGNKEARHSSQSQPAAREQEFKNSLPLALSMQAQSQLTVRTAMPKSSLTRPRPSLSPSHPSILSVRDPQTLSNCPDALFNFNGYHNEYQHSLFNSAFYFVADSVPPFYLQTG
jgi:hypothetical protein